MSLGDEKQDIAAFMFLLVDASLSVMVLVNDSAAAISLNAICQVANDGHEIFFRDILVLYAFVCV